MTSSPELGHEQDVQHLFRAIRKGKAHLTRFMLAASNNALLNCWSSEGRTPLIECCYIREEVTRDNMVRIIKEAGADVNMRDRNGRTPLIHACEQRCNDLVRIYIQHADISPDLEDLNGNTALIHSAYIGNDVALELLVRNFRRLGLQVDHFNHEGYTALHIAAKNGFLQCARILALKGKASLTLKDKVSQLTPLEWCLSEGYQKSEVEFLKPSAKFYRVAKLTTTMAKYRKKSSGGESMSSQISHQFSSPAKPLEKAKQKGKVKGVLKRSKAASKEENDIVAVGAGCVPRQRSTASSSSGTGKKQSKRHDDQLTTVNKSSIPARGAETKAGNDKQHVPDSPTKLTQRKRNGHVEKQKSLPILQVRNKQHSKDSAARSPNLQRSGTEVEAIIQSSKCVQKVETHQRTYNLPYAGETDTEDSDKSLTLQSFRQSEQVSETSESDPFGYDAPSTSEDRSGDSNTKSTEEEQLISNSFSTSVSLGGTDAFSSSDRADDDEDEDSGSDSPEEAEDSPDFSCESETYNTMIESVCSEVGGCRAVQNRQRTPWPRDKGDLSPGSPDTQSSNPEHLVVTDPCQSTQEAPVSLSPSVHGIHYKKDGECKNKHLGNTTVTHEHRTPLHGATGGRSQIPDTCSQNTSAGEYRQSATSTALSDGTPTVLQEPSGFGQMDSREESRDSFRSSSESSSSATTQFTEIPTSQREAVATSKGGSHNLTPPRKYVATCQTNTTNEPDLSIVVKNSLHELNDRILLMAETASDHGFVVESKFLAAASSGKSVPGVTDRRQSHQSDVSSSSSAAETVVCYLDHESPTPDSSTTS
ncbi:synphilin-1-like [Aplysia californica]|uniref:Synphilin-1-like n=1 Tax=Aplysia californica TaxID=6500 RepID=A0ABM0K327_APLCA|nr:synphilin-1-like [Aplysia californica]